jgi:transcriptional regulator with XRE-family HTH domain
VARAGQIARPLALRTHRPTALSGDCFRPPRTAASDRALEADLRRIYISILELGQQLPTLTTILKLAAALGHPAGEIVSMVEVELARPRKRRS